MDLLDAEYAAARKRQAFPVSVVLLCDLLKSEKVLSAQPFIIILVVRMLPAAVVLSAAVKLVR